MPLRDTGLMRFLRRRLSPDPDDGPRIHRRSRQETEKELRAGATVVEKPGGAEGGDHSPGVDRPGALPAKDSAPLGDTDQHSSNRNIPGRPRR